MYKELELWQFVRDRLERDRSVMLLVVAESSGSSPGRQGFKMAVSSDGELSGSIGGGVMEVRLVEQSRAILETQTPRPATSQNSVSHIIDQVHRVNSPNASGMICSGHQTVILKLLQPGDLRVVKKIISAIEDRLELYLDVGVDKFNVLPPKGGTQSETFQKSSDEDFLYCERLGKKNELYIVGGGHCALALSEIMSRMDFYIRIFDDRPDLNTIDKNRFADEITIIESYEQIGGLIPAGNNVYVAVMTLGFAADAVVIKQLIDKQFKYFGVLGSKAKMAKLFKGLAAEGIDPKLINKIKTPIGLNIGSHTPEEIAVSICAEIICIKNK